MTNSCKILAIDTSSEACSASLSINGESRTIFQIVPQKHSRHILQMCETLILEADLSLNQLDAVAFGRGPGSFTGLRIAAGVTQGIAFGADLPVIPISTLAALAQQLSQSQLNQHCLSIIDARMQEVYWGEFYINPQGEISPAGEEAVSSIDNIRLSHKKTIIGIGSGWLEYKDELNQLTDSNEVTEIFANKLVSAEEIAQLAAKELSVGNIVSAEHAIPVYLRNNVAKKSQKNR